MKQLVVVYISKYHNYMMKRFMWLLLIIITLIVDWSALDDITTGYEPDYLIEWVTLYTSLPVLVLSIWKVGKGQRNI